MKDSTLQSLRTVIALNINTVEKRISDLKDACKMLYDLAEKDSDTGREAFKLLNQARNDLRYFKGKLKVLVSLQKSIKEELISNSCWNSLDRARIHDRIIDDSACIELFGDYPSVPSWSDKIV